MFNYFISTILLLSFLTQSKHQDEYNMNLAIRQGNTNVVINSADTIIYLKKDEFSILFNSEIYNEKKELFFCTKIAFTLVANDMSLIKEGEKLDNIAYFSPGTGYACRRNEQYNYYVIGGGHHCVMYTDDEKRAALENSIDETLRLRCDVKGFYQHMEVPIKKFNPSTVYMIIVNDANLNDKLDKNEFRTVTIRFDKD